MNRSKTANKNLPVTVLGKNVKSHGSGPRAAVGKQMAEMKNSIEEAVKSGHVTVDSNGLYRRTCGRNCNCLPVVGSSIAARSLRR